jgi:hypothetical protein
MTMADVWGRQAVLSVAGSTSDGCETVIVAGSRMLYEVAIRGMDPDLFEQAQREQDTPQGVVHRYAELHYARHGEEWTGYHVW